jgi:MFS family permease
VTAIVGAALSGRPAWGGVPNAFYQTGAALAAFAWGHAMDRWGRRRTLVLGMAAGLLGATAAGAGVGLRSLPLFLAGVLFMGTANSALQLGRFVAAEVHPPAERGRAISRVVLGGTVGAVFGPWAVGPAGRAAHAFGPDPLAGAFAVSAVLFAVVAGVLAVGLRPEPRELAREVALRHPASATEGVARPLGAVLRDPVAAAAVLTMASGQVVMTMLMVITSLHMAHHHHPLSSISAVLSSHVVGMYAFSIVSGRLADRAGRPLVIALGALALLGSCVAAPLSPEVLPLAASLFLLGLGWNFCYVGGSALLADRLRVEERARVQGANDFLIGVASATGSLGSGLVFAAHGYAIMGAVGAVVSLVPLVLAGVAHRSRRH